MTISTVDYGDVYPVAADGKRIAMVPMLLGIALFSAITATATSYLLATAEPTYPRRSGRCVEEIHRLAALREQGFLTDEEFATAKAGLLRYQPGSDSTRFRGSSRPLEPITDPHTTGRFLGQ